MKANCLADVRHRSWRKIYGLLPLLLLLSAARPAAATVSGYLDFASCGVIYGWAWDSSHPALKLSVDLYSDGNYLTTMVANVYRADLQAAGIGDGYHGFSDTSIPLSIRNGVAHNIDAKVSGVPLTRSPQPLFCPTEATGYEYYSTSTFTGGIDGGKWTQLGSLSTSGGVLGSASSGTLLSTVTPPGGSPSYEVDVTLALKGSGGTYAVYLGATSQALAGNGTYYAIRVINPTFTGSSCSATLEGDQITNGAYTVLNSVTIPCFDGEMLRVAYVPGYIVVLTGGSGLRSVYQQQLSVTQTTGVPAVGVSGTPANNGLSIVALGPHDSIAPGAISASSVRTSVSANLVTMAWPGVVDDPNGVGWIGYNVYRDSQYFAWTRDPEFEDPTVGALQTHTYTLESIDLHGNYQDTNITISTPPANSVDPRRIGIRPTGSYWGAAGEQVDVQSGNLNFSVPLIKAQARGGWGATLVLSYNSQVWRQDPNAIWKLGEDIGYGFGWRLLAGSITPVWSDYTTLDHLVYTDATGAEYWLNVNTNGVWTSRQGVYVSYDYNASRLYFPDGSFWFMGAQSGGNEQDAGTLYPSLIEDTNGNQIQISYGVGLNAVWPNSSARITQIDDARKTAAYQFSYNADATPHLTGITNQVGTAETYSFAYASKSLTSPFSTQAFGGTTLLQTLSVPAGQNVTIAHAFEYTVGNPSTTTTGEMSHMTTPLGGQLWWQYGTFTYNPSPPQYAGQIYRQVSSRSMAPSSGAAQYSWTFANDNVTTNVHSWTTIQDNGTNTKKVWWFQTNSGPYLGFAIGYSDRNASGVDISHKDYTWTQDANGTPYVGTVLTTMDPGQSYAAQSQTTQTLDAYGNLTQSKAYDFGNLTTPARTYNYTYLTDANYVSRYIRNRLTSATVTTASGTLTLTSKSYDSTVCGALQDPPGAPGSIPFHDANYSTSFTYRGNPTYVTNLGTSTCAAYQTTGVTYQAQNGVGTVIATAPSASTGYSLPGVVTPNGNGNLATSVSYANSWAVTSVTGPNGASATTTYDSYGRPWQSTIPDGAVTNYAYTYNPNTQTASMTDTQGTRWTKSTLDGFGRVTSVVKGHDSTPLSEVDTRYAPCACSPLGKMSQVSEPYAPNTTVYWTTYTYDSSGRPISVKAADNTSVTSYAYTGNTTQVTDAAGKWKKNTTDSFGNLTNVLEPDTPHGYNNSTTYTYNGVNQLTQVSMQTASGTQTRTFTWSGADLVRTTNPENGTVNYTYDGAHHVLTRTDAKNQQTQYTYDIYGRLTYIYHFPQAPAYPGDPNHPADPNQQVSYYYDSNPFDGTFSSYAWGRLTSVTFGNACQAGAAAATAGYTYMYGYTVPGRVSAQRMRTTVNQSNPVNWSCSPITVDQNASYGWDSEGRMTSMAYPGGVASYQYQYDAMGHLNGMTDSLHSNATVATASYGPAGEMDSLVHGGVNENFSYNSMWQLTGDAAMTYFYTAGQNNGRITQSTDRASGEVVNYTYDSLNRLASAQATNGSWGNTYSYDGFGNLTAKTVTAGTAPNFAASYNPASNQQNGLNYDANGNVAMPNGSAPYDVENRLLYSADGVYAFGYDPQGKRVLRQSGSGTYPAPLTYNSEFSFYGITGQLLATFVIWSTTDGTQSGYPYQVSPAVLKNVYFGGG